MFLWMRILCCKNLKWLEICVYVLSVWNAMCISLLNKWLLMLRMQNYFENVVLTFFIWNLMKWMILEKCECVVKLIDNVKSEWKGSDVTIYVIEKCFGLRSWVTARQVGIGPGCMAWSQWTTDYSGISWYNLKNGMWPRLEWKDCD